MVAARRVNRVMMSSLVIILAGTVPVRMTRPSYVRAKSHQSP